MTAPLMISPFATVRWAGAEVRAASLLAAEGVATDSSVLLLVLHAFARPRPRSEVIRELTDVGVEEVDEIITALVSAGVLVAAAPSCSWSPHDLAFHQASTMVTGTLKRAGRAQTDPGPTDASRPAMSLPTASTPAPGSLAAALIARRSVRRFEPRPIGLAQLGSLLDRAARQRGESRPYPSGGGVYSLGLYLAVAEGSVEGLQPGIYHYRPDDHGLDLVSADAEACDAMVRQAASMMGVDPPAGAPVVVLVTSRFRSVSDEYGEIAYRLVLLEAGCLLQNFYLVASSVGLGACGLGVIPGRARFQVVTGLDPLTDPLVLAFVVGRCAAEAT